MLVLVRDRPEHAGSTGTQARTRTVFSGVTNGTERNDLLGGNYAHRDENLPAGWGYQNVGKVVEVAPEVGELEVADMLPMSADHFECVVME